VAGIGTSNVKAKELDSPLAWGAGVVSGSVPPAGAATAESIIISSRNGPDRCTAYVPIATAV
jgi:hypothetical protein